MTLRLVKFEGEGASEVWINPEAVASVLTSLVRQPDGPIGVYESGVLINLIGGTGYVVKGTIRDALINLEAKY